jgi:putative ABC transport system substrate-binding protein
VRWRKFIALFHGIAMMWPLVAGAQKPAMPVIGFIGSASPARWSPFVAAFWAGLSETGYVEDKNVAIELRWAEGPPSSGGSRSGLAAKATTSTIPIVFTSRP